VKFFTKPGTQVPGFFFITAGSPLTLIHTLNRQSDFMTTATVLERELQSASM